MVPVTFVPRLRAQGAAQRIQAMYEQHDVHLDYSVGSLHKVDGLIDDLRYHYHNPERVQAILYGLGCYTGEVISREFKAEWISGAEAKEPLVEHIPLLMRVGSTFCNPLTKVAMRFDHGLTHGATALYLLLKTNLPRPRRSFSLNLF